MITILFQISQNSIGNNRYFYGNLLYLLNLLQSYRVMALSFIEQSVQVNYSVNTIQLEICVCHQNKIICLYLKAGIRFNQQAK